MVLQKLMLNHKCVVSFYVFQTIFSLIFSLLFVFFIRIVIRGSGVSIFDIIPALYYNSITLHGLLMIFFVFSTAFFGVVVNMIAPICCNLSDFIYPQLNLFASVILGFGLVFVVLGIFFNSGAGWVLLPPHSELLGGSLKFVVSGLLCALISTTVGGINLFQTVFNSERLQASLIFVAVLVASIILFVVVPVLLVGVVGIVGDVCIGSNLFNAFGDPVLYQHIFWFFGHPEVYILALPAFGIVSEFISILTRCQIFSLNSMVVALIIIGFVGFFVWGHHMFTTGLGINDRLLYMCASIAISIPTSLKLINWVVSLCGHSGMQLGVVRGFGFGFIGLFVVGGISGLILANSSINVLLHDTFFVVAHFHYILSIAVALSLLMFILVYFEVLFAVPGSYTVFVVLAIIFGLSSNLIFMPLHILGFIGIPRRVFDVGSVFGLYTQVASIGVVGLCCFIVLLFGCVVVSVSFSSLGLLRFLFYIPVPWGAAGRRSEEPASYMVYLKYTEDGRKEVIVRKMTEDDIDFIVLMRVSLAGYKLEVVSTRELNRRLERAAEYYRKKNLPQPKKPGLLAKLGLQLLVENLIACFVAVLKVYGIIFVCTLSIVLVFFVLAYGSHRARLRYEYVFDEKPGRVFNVIVDSLDRIFMAIFWVWLILMLYFLYVAIVFGVVLAILTVFGGSWH